MYPGRGIIFCGPREVYSALHSSAIVVYVLLITQNLLPVWIYAFVVTRRLFRDSQNKSKSSLLLPLVPVLNSCLAALVVILPCTGVFVESLLDITLVLGLMLFFNIADKIVQTKEGNETKQRWKTLNNFLLSIFLFLLLWSKQIIVFMDLINLPNYKYQSFFTLSASNIARAVSLLIAAASFYLSKIKIQSLKSLKEDINVNLGLYMLLWYGLFQAIWMFSLFVEENQMFKDLSPAFHKYHVGHFVKNIQKVFLVVFIGVPFIQSCGAFHEQYKETLKVSEENEENIEVTTETETEINEEDRGDVRRSSITTFFSLKGNELYNEGNATADGHHNEAFEEKSPSFSRQVADNRSI